MEASFLILQSVEMLYDHNLHFQKKTALNKTVSFSISFIVSYSNTSLFM